MEEVGYKNFRQEFFRYRNGIVADALKRAGSPYKTIFGLDIPRIAEIASATGFDAEEADRLWGDRDCRESRLLATYLWQPDITSEAKALELALDCQCTEEADMLAFRLFKRMVNPNYLLQLLEEHGPAADLAARSLRRHLE